MRTRKKSCPQINIGFCRLKKNQNEKVNHKITRSQQHLVVSKLLQVLCYEQISKLHKEKMIKQKKNPKLRIELQQHGITCSNNK